MTQFTDPRILTASRVAWIAIALMTVGLFIVALPTRVAQLMTDPYLLAEGLQSLGLSVRWFAVYGTVLDVLVAMGFVLIATLLYWLRSDDWMVWLVSLSMIMFLITILPVTTVLAEASPTWRLPLRLFRAFGFAILLSVLLIFPDGRLAPPAARLVLYSGLVYFVLWIIFPGLAPPTAFTDLRVPANGPQVIPMFVFLLAVGVVQAYRYRKIYDRVQRQQVRWVVLALLGAFAILVVLALPPLLLPALGIGGMAFTPYLLVAIPATLFSFLLFPLTVAMAVLRYRLWDIDVLIRRTLIYGALTATLAVVYFGTVVAMQWVFRSLTGQTSPLAVVLSTLIIAALFNPLRHRIQHDIDRRFYRRKVDAQQAMAAFAQVARNETDLDVLTAEVVHTVEQMMQPEHVSLWLRTDR